jgi:predicted nucleic acid-binding protein
MMSKVPGSAPHVDGGRPARPEDRGAARAVVKFLLDTNALAEAVRPAPNAGFLKRLRASDAKLAIAAVTAAVAVVNALTLVTANMRDFRHVDGPRVENWWV